ncbi:MAG: hypothetical protein LH702_36655 [Phormidesmis sp. CAN_BIN44]|nr:hypothetical protein [Phormidesmis sp. CAN_BIN44]
MMRKANVPALRSQLDTIATQIEVLTSEGVLLGHRIKVVRPGGSAGKPSHQNGYARLIGAKGSKAIAPDAVAPHQAEIDRGRELLRLQKQQIRLIERIDKSIDAAK